METEEAVYFFTPPFYTLDNFSAYIVKIWGKKFLTSEHAYQWKKYSISHPDIADQILNTTNPSDAKKIADAHRADVSPNWEKEKADVMKEIIRAKIQQHEKVQRVLTKTGDKEIFENSPNDSFWGVGPEGTGQNMLGKIWMQLRDELRKGTTGA